MTDRWLEPTHEDFDKIRREKHPDLYAEYNQKCSLAELEVLNQQMRENQAQKSQRVAQEFVNSKEEIARVAKHRKAMAADREARAAASHVTTEFKVDDTPRMSARQALELAEATGDEKIISAEYERQLLDAKSMYSVFDEKRFRENIESSYRPNPFNPLQTATDSKYVWTGFCELKPLTGSSVIVRDRWGNHHVCPHFVNIDQKETDLIAWFTFERFPFVSYEK